MTIDKRELQAGGLCSGRSGKWAAPVKLRSFGGTISVINEEVRLAPIPLDSAPDTGHKGGRTSCRVRPRPMLRPPQFKARGVGDHAGKGRIIRPAMTGRRPAADHDLLRMAVSL